MIWNKKRRKALRSHAQTHVKSVKCYPRSLLFSQSWTDAFSNRTCICAGLFDEYRGIFNHLTPTYKQATVLWNHPRKVFACPYFAFHSKLPITCDTKKSCQPMTGLQSFPSFVTRSVPSVSYFSMCVSFCILLDGINSNISDPLFLRAAVCYAVCVAPQGLRLLQHFALLYLLSLCCMSQCASVRALSVCHSFYLWHYLYKIVGQ